MPEARLRRTRTAYREESQGERLDRLVMAMDRWAAKRDKQSGGFAGTITLLKLLARSVTLDEISAGVFRRMVERMEYE